MKNQIIFIAMLTCLPSILAAQSFVEWKKNGWRLGIDEGHPAMADIDADGQMDLLIGVYDGSLQHFEQSQVDAESFSFVQYNCNDIDVGVYATPAFTDLDDDGLLDLIIGELDGNLNHYEQTAENMYDFTLVNDNINNINVGNGSSPCISDLDMDGQLDLLIGSLSGSLYHYEQKSANPGEWMLITENVNVDVSTVKVAVKPIVTDLDHDGLFDLVLGGNYNDIAYYEQDAAGSATFNLQDARLLDISHYYNSTGPCFVDLDNDNRLDVLVGEADGLYLHLEQDSVNSADFVLRSKNILALMDAGSDAAPCLTDLDDDGLVDLIVGEWYGNLNHYEQTAAGSPDFIKISEELGETDVGTSSTPAIADLDNDGLFDLIVGERDGTLNHFEQDEDNPDRFTLLAENFNGIKLEQYSAPCLTDLDGDELIDMIVGENGGKLYLYEQRELNSTAFHLVDDSMNVASNYPHPTPYVVDYDNDGLLDLFIGRNFGGVNHFEQASKNSSDFILIANVFENITVRNNAYMTTGNVNNDELPDLILGDKWGGLYLYLKQPDTRVQLPPAGESIVEQFQLYKNFPNPFNPNTRIPFRLESRARINLRIYNAVGREIRSLSNSLFNPGYHTIVWDGKDNWGHDVSSGVYYYQIKVGKDRKTEQMTLIR